jgi:hypothetical protein
VLRVLSAWLIQKTLMATRISAMWTSSLTDNLHFCNRVKFSHWLFAAEREDPFCRGQCHRRLRGGRTCFNKAPEAIRWQQCHQHTVTLGKLNNRADHRNDGYYKQGHTWNRSLRHSIFLNVRCRYDIAKTDTDMTILETARNKYTGSRPLRFRWWDPKDNLS